MKTEGKNWNCFKIHPHVPHLIILPLGRLPFSNMWSKYTLDAFRAAAVEAKVSWPSGFRIRRTNKQIPQIIIKKPEIRLRRKLMLIMNKIHRCSMHPMIHVSDTNSNQMVLAETHIQTFRGRILFQRPNSCKSGHQWSCWLVQFHSVPVANWDRATTELS